MSRIIFPTPVSWSKFALILTIATLTDLTGCALNSGATRNGGGSSISSPSTTLRIGQTMQLDGEMAGVLVPAATWQVIGTCNGTITSSGLYTAPPAIPIQQTVTIVATFLGEESSIAITILNPSPLIESVSPQVVTTSNTAFDIHGSGFLPSSTVVIGGTPVVPRYVSATELQVAATVSPNVSSVALSVDNPDPGASSSPAFSEPVSIATFSVLPNPIPLGKSTVTLSGQGFTAQSIVQVDGTAAAATYVSPTCLTVNVDVLPWRKGLMSIAVSTPSQQTPNVQVAAPIQSTPITYDAASRLSMQAGFGPRPDLVMHIQALGTEAFLNEQLQQPAYQYTNDATHSPSLEWMVYASQGNSVLRQRVANALTELFPLSVGDVGGVLGYWETELENDSFGNFRKLLDDLSTNAETGSWLNVAGNNYYSWDPVQHPDQNYARELMQLFTIGLVMLNDDGSQQLDVNGAPIPSYGEDTVLDMSRALTGWEYPPAQNPAWTSKYGIDYSIPLVPNEAYHDPGSKTLFGTVILPAGSDTATDEKAVLDTLFQHPNLPPFISFRLIQKLVTSNPSPAYIQRISRVFEDDGTGVRGNLGAVVKAILMDPEARAGDTVQDNTTGFLQDPRLWELNLVNGLQFQYSDGEPVDVGDSLGEPFWSPPTVFGFDSPLNKLPGGTLYSPEFQIFNNVSLTLRSQFTYNMIEATQGGFTMDYWPTSWLFTEFQTVPTLLDAVNHMFFHGFMPSGTQQKIIDYCQSQTQLSQRELFTRAIFLALNSDNFQVER